MLNKSVCLAVNTATTRLSVALVTEAGGRLYLYETDETRNQGNLLFAHIQRGMAENGLTYADIGLLAVVTGPGSFTGIRIGLSAMRGIALAAGIPITGVSSFDLYTAPEADNHAVNVVAIESWREELYFRATAPDGTVLIQPVNESAEAFAARELMAHHDDIIISGDAAERLAEYLPHAKVITGQPNAIRVAEIALAVGPTGEKPVPFYLREADISKPKMSF